jgi:hypothetical protein
MQADLDLTYNEIDAILAMIGSTINTHETRNMQAPKWSDATIALLRKAEAKLEAVVGQADPDDE